MHRTMVVKQQVMLLYGKRTPEQFLTYPLNQSNDSLN